MTTSNTHECFTEFIGQKVVGCLFNACPPQDRALASGTKTLVFEDGRGLTIASNGSYWTESVETIKRAVRIRERELRDTESEIRGVLAVAGALGEER